MIASIRHEPPWLDVLLAQPVQACSWAVVAGGWRRIRGVAWRQVDTHDLPPERDPAQWLESQMAARGRADTLGFLTSHPLRHYVSVYAEMENIRVDCVATVGLGNGRRVGDPPGPGRVGTINMLCAVSVPLTQTAALEAMALAAEARTTACLDSHYLSPISNRPITGTGTDCIAVVSPPDVGRPNAGRPDAGRPDAGRPDAGRYEKYAGKHTAVGFLIGKTALEAVTTGIGIWEKHGSHG